MTRDQELHEKIKRARSAAAELTSALSKRSDLISPYREAKAVERALEWVDAYVTAREGERQN